MSVNVATWSAFNCSTCGIAVNAKHVGEHGHNKAVDQWAAAPGGRCFQHWFANLSNSAKRNLKREPQSGVALV